MRILICEPGKRPYVSDIPHTLAAMQKVVGGIIQSIHPWDEAVALVCDDESILKGAPFNRVVKGGIPLFGTFFICGVDSEDFTDLPASLAEMFAEELNEPHALLLTPKGCMVLPMDAFNETEVDP